MTTLGIEMLQNIELKAMTQDFGPAERALQGLGFDVSTLAQSDRYLLSNGSYVKIRCNDGKPSALITYSRQVAPKGRPSKYSKIDSDILPEIAQALDPVVAVGVVEKRRTQFRRSDVIVNLDEIADVGRFIEIEVTSQATHSNGDLIKWMKLLDIKSHDIIPYSNIHLVNMFATARRHKAARKGDFRRMLALDGPSASGKSTLKAALLESGKFAYACRDTTRSPRPDDAISNDYSFVSQRDYFESALLGKYIEFRDYEFGMSYGVRWSEIENLLDQGSVPLALINLGNGAMVKRLLPEAITVLLIAEPAIVEARLRSRGSLREEQIEERVVNSKLALDYSHAYDIVIDTGVRSVGSIVDELIRENSRHELDRNILSGGLR
jgi:guanylate kinase/adenylate cyclase class IV